MPFRVIRPFLNIRVLGHELSGVIEEAGDTDFKDGQAVLIIPYLHCGECLACRKRD